MRLEDFGITLDWVTSKLVGYTIGFILSCALGILLYCLFSIGLARIAKAKGEEKEWYAYLPLLRFYTLGKMAPGSEKTKKIFACLLPSLAVVRFVLIVVTGALFARAMAAIIFAAEGIAGSSFNIEQLITFPISYLIAVIIITAVISLAYKLVYAFSYYGAVKHTGGAKPIVFTLIAFFWCELGCVLLFVASREKHLKKLTAEGKAD